MLNKVTVYQATLANIDFGNASLVENVENGTESCEVCCAVRAVTQLRCLIRANFGSARQGSLTKQKCLEIIYFSVFLVCVIVQRRIKNRLWSCNML